MLGVSSMSQIIDCLSIKCNNVDYAEIQSAIYYSANPDESPEALLYLVFKLKKTISAKRPPGRFFICANPKSINGFDKTILDSESEVEQAQTIKANNYTARSDTIKLIQEINICA